MSEPRPAHYRPERTDWYSALSDDLALLHACVDRLQQQPPFPADVQSRLDHLDQCLDALRGEMREVMLSLAGVKTQIEALSTWRAVIVACGKMLLALLPFVGGAVALIWWLGTILAPLLKGTAKP